VTVYWIALLVALSAPRTAIELPPHYDTRAECAAAVVYEQLVYGTDYALVCKPRVANLPFLPPTVPGTAPKH
jgi:hypothetical protein